MGFKSVIFVIFSLVWFSSTPAASQPTKIRCLDHPMYCDIIQFNPSINKQQAMRLSNLLIRHGRKTGHDPWLSLAIAKQESSLRYKTRKQPVFIPKKECDDYACQLVYHMADAVLDLGLFQLHASTVRAFNFDAQRLVTDLEYMVVTHYQVLTQKKKECKAKGKRAWACYHSRDPILNKRYQKRVYRYYIGSKKKLKQRYLKK